MVCKKCGKEFTSDNNICPFCNNDNNLSDNSATTTQPVVETKTEEVESLLEPVTPTPADETSKPAESEVEVLLEPAKPATQPEPEVEVLLEPAKPDSEQAPAVVPEVETLVEQKSEPATQSATETVAEPVAENQTVATPPENASSPTTITESNTESTTETSTNADDDEEPEEKKKIEPRIIVMGIIILILTVIVVIMYLPKNGEETNTNNTDTNTNTNNTNDEEENIPTTVKYWEGTYTNDKFEIAIQETDANIAYIFVSDIATNGATFAYENVFENYTQEQLYKVDESIEAEYTLTVTKTEEGIEVFAVARDSGSTLNDISGTYIKVS